MISDLRSRALGKKALAYWERREQCPACAQEYQNGEMLLQTLLEGAREAEMRQALEKSLGLCMRHLPSAERPTASR